MASQSGLSPVHAPGSSRNYRTAAFGGFATLASLNAVGDGACRLWIEGCYNPHRRHSDLDYLSPIKARVFVSVGRYLLVGTVGSEEWLHSTHGTKIIRAVELKREGRPLAIVSERPWTATLAATSPQPSWIRN